MTVAFAAVETVVARTPRTRRRARLLAVVGLSALTVGLAALPRPDRHRVEASTGVEAEPGLSRAAAEVAEDGRVLHLRSRISGPSTRTDALRIAWQPEGAGFVYGGALPPLGPMRTYQLWAVVGGQRVSVGVLGSRPGLAPFSAGGAAVEAFALTDEPRGGVESSSNTALAWVRLEG